jgi:hypothetical protein
MGFFLKKNRGGWGSMAIRFPLYQELSFLWRRYSRTWGWYRFRFAIFFFFFAD